MLEHTTFNVRFAHQQLEARHREARHAYLVRAAQRAARAARAAARAAARLAAPYPVKTAAASQAGPATAVRNGLDACTCLAGA